MSKLSWRDRKELPSYKTCLKKNTDRIYAEIVFKLHDAKHFIPSNIYTSKSWQINVLLIVSSKKHLKRSIHFQN